jgi:hypothetical protein
MSFDEDQNEILSLSDELDKIHGRGWSRYKGDVIARKVIALCGDLIKLISSWSTERPGNM